MLCRKFNALGAEISELSLLCSRGQFASEPDHLAEYSNVLNFALYSGYEKRKITRKVLADKLGVIAFHSSEIVDKRRILDRVMKAIAEKIGRGHRESYPTHNFSSPKWKILKL